MRGDFDQARSIAEEAIQGHRALQDGWGTARMLNLLAGVAWVEGDCTTAHTLCAEALSLLRTVGEPWNLGRALIRMGLILVDEAEYEEAEATLRESLLAWRNLHNDGGMTLSLAGLIVAAAAQGNRDRAERLYASEPFHQSAGRIPLDGFSDREFEHMVGLIRAQLGNQPPNNFPVITLQEAVSCALEEPSPAISRHHPGL
jgi:hypothetical protein